MIALFTVQVAVTGNFIILLFVNPNFWTLVQAYPVDGTLVIHQKP